MKKKVFGFLAALSLVLIPNANAASPQIDYETGYGVNLVGNGKYSRYNVLGNSIVDEDIITLMSHNIICEVPYNEVQGCLDKFKAQLEKELKQAGGDVTGLKVRLINYSEVYEHMVDKTGELGAMVREDKTAVEAIPLIKGFLKYAQSGNVIKAGSYWTESMVKDPELQYNPDVLKEMPEEVQNMVYVVEMKTLTSQAYSQSESYGVRPVIEIKKSNISTKDTLKDVYYYGDIENNLVVTSAEQNSIPDGTQVEIGSINEGAYYDLIDSIIDSSFISYDINLKNESQVIIQPNGKVKIRIPIPEELKNKELEVSRITESGEKFNYEYKIVNNFVEFETDHFSMYVVSEKKEAKTETNTEIKTEIKEETITTESKNETLDEDQIENPNTGDNIKYVFISLGLVLVGISVCGYKLKKKNN